MRSLRTTIEDMDAAVERVGKIFGIAAISRAAVCDKDFDSHCGHCEGIPARRAAGGKDV